MNKGKQKKTGTQKTVRGISLLGLEELYPNINSPEYVASPANSIELMCQLFKIALDNYLKGKSRTPRKLCLQFILLDCEQRINVSSTGSKALDLLNAFKVVTLAA